MIGVLQFYPPYESFVLETWHLSKYKNFTFLYLSQNLFMMRHLSRLFTLKIHYLFNLSPSRIGYFLINFLHYILMIRLNLDLLDILIISLL